MNVVFLGDDAGREARVGGQQDLGSRGICRQDLAHNAIGRHNRHTLFHARG